jgi:hypothetical protein
MMQRLLSLGLALAVAMTVSPSFAEPARATPASATPVRKGFHPIRAVRAKWRRERALSKIQKIVRAKPRLVVKFRERYGKLGGKKQFGSKSQWTALGMGTAINIGGVVDPDRALYYLAASTLVGLGTAATHVIKNKRTRRKAIISMIEDKTISDTDLKPFRDALGLNARNRRLTPQPTPEPEPTPEPTPEQPSN